MRGTNLWEHSIAENELWEQLIYGATNLLGHSDRATNLRGTVMGQQTYGDTLIGQLIYICTLMGATNLWGHWHGAINL